MSENITPEQLRKALCTVTIQLTGGMFDKNEKWIPEEDIIEGVRSWGIQSDVLLMSTEDGGTVGIPLREVEKFVVKGI